MNVSSFHNENLFSNVFRKLIIVNHHFITCTLTLFELKVGNHIFVLATTTAAAPIVTTHFRTQPPITTTPPTTPVRLFQMLVNCVC